MNAKIVVSLLEIPPLNHRVSHIVSQLVSGSVSPIRGEFRVFFWHLYSIQIRVFLYIRSYSSLCLYAGSGYMILGSGYSMAVIVSINVINILRSVVPGKHIKISEKTRFGKVFCFWKNIFFFVGKKRPRSFFCLFLTRNLSYPEPFLYYALSDSLLILNRLYTRNRRNINPEPTYNIWNRYLCWTTWMLQLAFLTFTEEAR